MSDPETRGEADDMAGDLADILWDAPPEVGLIAAERLRTEIPRVQLRHVEALLAQGHTWASIGALLGIQRQSAFERFRKGGESEPQE